VEERHPQASFGKSDIYSTGEKIQGEVGVIPVSHQSHVWAGWKYSTCDRQWVWAFVGTWGWLGCFFNKIGWVDFIGLNINLKQKICANIHFYTKVIHEQKCGTTISPRTGEI
jgi:hypothetical protein